MHIGRSKATNTISSRRLHHPLRPTRDFSSTKVSNNMADTNPKAMLRCHQGQQTQGRVDRECRMLKIVQWAQESFPIQASKLLTKMIWDQENRLVLTCKKKISIRSIQGIQSMRVRKMSRVITTSFNSIDKNRSQDSRIWGQRINKILGQKGIRKGLVMISSPTF